MASKGLYRGKTPKGTRLGGRKKGTPNKFTATVKEAFELAFTTLQTDKTKSGPSLAQWARRNPGDFYKIAAKLIPTQLTGEGGGPIAVAAAVTVYLPDNNRRAPVGAPELAVEGKKLRVRIRPRPAGGASP